MKTKFSTPILEANNGETQNQAFDYTRILVGLHAGAHMLGLFAWHDALYCRSSFVRCRSRSFITAPLFVNFSFSGTIRWVWFSSGWAVL